MTQSLILGLLFGFLNFWLLTKIVKGLVRKEEVKPWKTLLAFLMKILLLFGTIGLLLKKGYVTPLPFLAGYTVSLIASIIMKIFFRDPHASL